MRKTLANAVKYRTLYLFLVPALVTVFFFSYRPMIGLIMAFQEFNMKDGWLNSPFVGLSNFVNFLRDADFYRALLNTLGLGFLNTIVIFPLPIIFALLLNEIKFIKFKRVSQTVSYLPHFVSWIIVTSLVTRFLDYRTGMLNNLLASFGLERIGFMREADYFWTIVIISSIWKGLGWGSIIYLSALSGVNQELYEAARVDGAGRWKQTVYVTLPSIMPTIGLMFILSVGGMISTGGLFDAVYNLSNPMVASKAYTLELYVYYQGIIYLRYGYAQAIYLAQSLIALGMVLGANKIYRRLNDDASVF